MLHGYFRFSVDQFNDALLELVHSTMVSYSSLIFFVKKQSHVFCLRDHNDHCDLHVYQSVMLTVTDRGSRARVICSVLCSASFG